MKDNERVEALRREHYLALREAKHKSGMSLHEATIEAYKTVWRIKDGRQNS